MTEKDGATDKKSNGKGKLIVIYGGNNIGKTTQVKQLVGWLKQEGHDAVYLKYPVYDSPTGKRINGILREQKEKNISEQEFQELYYENRKEFEPQLRKLLNQGKIVVAEDYIGTSLAWGSAKGADYKYLKKLNSDLIQEDLCILMDGKRFLAGKEKGHIHEENKQLMETVRERHEKIGKELCWQMVSANQGKEKVFEDIKKIVEKVL
jgi:thymidylate kinase